MNKTPLYYFCENAIPQFVKESDFQSLKDVEKRKYKPASFKDVRLYGSDELKEEIELYKQASQQRHLMFGALA